MFYGIYGFQLIGGLTIWIFSNWAKSFNEAREHRLAIPLGMVISIFDFFMGYLIYPLFILRIK